MENSTLYDMIFKRKSIRKYNQTPLDEKTLQALSDYIKSVSPLHPDMQIEMRIVGHDEIKILLPIKAPHYIVFYSEEKDGYLTNAGFILQQIDLYLSSNGLGSCYLGMAQPTKVAKNSSNLEFVMVLAFGHTNESVHRTSITEYRRKALNEITNITNMNQLLETARLAPSASNGQPWFFTANGQSIHIYCMKQNIFKAMLYEKMNKLDIGIALCHLDIATAHEGKKAAFLSDQQAAENPPKGYFYITTMRIN